MMRALAFVAMTVGTCLAGIASAGELRLDVGTNDSPAYEKECGSCHFPYQPGWLPERSWRRLLGSLGNHFGDNAELTASNRDVIAAYLTSRAADHATNARSRDLVAALPASETPISVTKVLYVGGIHGGFLDPNFKGTPATKTLAQCPLCHQKASRGWFSAVTYTVSDVNFRVDDVDQSASLPVPSWLRMGSKK